MNFDELLVATKKLQGQNTSLEIEHTNLENKYTNLENKYTNLETQNVSLESKVSRMQFQIDQLTRLLFGVKRERFISNENHNQMELPFDVEQTKPEPEKTEEISYTRKKKERKNHPGRLPLPDHLPVEEIIIEPKEDTSGMKYIGKEVTDQLELVPAKLFIKRFIRPKYIKPEDNESLNFKGVIAELPVFPIEKGIAGSGLLAQIIIDKYVDHLPIYRQIQRFARENVRIPSNTINGWQDAISRLLAPLFEKQKQLVLRQGYLQVDETPIKVLDKRLKGKCHQGYYWVYNSPIQNAVLFDYRKGRGREGPKQMLKDFKGYLQSDGYSVYDWFGKKEHITLLNCWAHARRYFEKALNYDKAAKDVLLKIQKLYAIERFAKNMELSTNERKEIRLEHSLPILNELSKWMIDNLSKHLPKSPMGEALRYTIPRWDNLMAYLYDGTLEIDNNLVENAIRPNALGRKNYLFAGSHESAQRAAMFYSFFGTCKRNDINPFDWLKNVLDRIPEHKANKLNELLPQNWKPQKSE
ncbi:MAG: IS66 family transposase [Candidatus Cloacimonadota bacterium]|nr:IS66 family transposase [Candidatus Cloacimonadota bacterium]